MTIQPIGAYPLYVTSQQTYKTTKKTKTAKPHISDKSNLRVNDNDLFDPGGINSMQEGDTESSEQWFRTRLKQNEVGSGFDDDTFIQHLHHAESIEDHYHLDHESGIYTPRVRQSSKNISPPEALIYYTLLNHPSTTHLHASLQLEEFALSSDVIQWALGIQCDSLSFYWKLHYHLDSRKIDFYLNGNCVGYSFFRIRGFRVEEIEGIIHNEPLTIDPVWHPTKENVLREESLTIGSHHLKLIYHLNEIYSIGNPNKSLKVKQKPIKRMRSKSVIRKCVSCLHLNGHGQLLYTKGILMPICAEWKLDTENK